MSKPQSALARWRTKAKGSFRWLMAYLASKVVAFTAAQVPNHLWRHSVELVV